MIDLHIHTTCSDGQFSPAQTIQMAAQAEITVASITDHDTTSGIAEAQEAACQCGIELIPGIEISVQGGRELHILGYGISPKHPALQLFCRENAENRIRRRERMLEYLLQQGAEITLDDVRFCNDGRTTGRPHFARTLVAKGYADSVQDAFDRYLTTPEFYKYVERPKPSPEKGLRVIQEAGGVAVLAHPYQLQLESDAMAVLLEKLIAYGLQGIEAYYSRHTPAQTEAYLRLARRYHLFVTCGSDFHGPAIKPDITLGTGINGNLGIRDTSIPERLKQAIAAANKCI